MEAASIAVMEANFEAQIGMTVEERIAELEENRGIRFYSFIGQQLTSDTEKGEATEHDVLGIMASGVVVGTREMYFEGVDKVLTVLELSSIHSTP